MAKKEEYLKDEKSFADFLYDWAQEQTLLKSDSKELEQKEWQKLLSDLKIFDYRLKEIAQAYRIAYDHLYHLVMFARTQPWKEQDGTEVLLENLKNYFKKYQIHIEDGQPFETAISDKDEKGELLTVQPPYVIFQRLTRQWKIELKFFTSQELSILHQLTKPLELIEDKSWILQIIGKERILTDQGIMRLVKAIGEISKPYMTVQRYKGLGEMNPDQLWETAMDQKTRTLLKVTIEDALEADSWFSTLMGDDVEGRRKYIIQNGQFVKNLDV